MKRRHAILVSLVLGTAGSLGCGDMAAPTEPIRPAADFQKVPAPPHDLSGDWSGTITFHAFESEDEPLLCDGVVSIRVTLRQDRDSLSGEFSTPCAGRLSIRGTLQQSGLSGALDAPGSRNYGFLSGTVFSNQIRFQTARRIDKSSGNAITTEVELHRQAPSPRSPRTPPILSDGGRSHRAVALGR